MRNSKLSKQDKRMRRVRIRRFISKFFPIYTSLKILAYVKRGFKPRQPHKPKSGPGIRDQFGGNYYNNGEE